MLVSGVGAMAKVHANRVDTVGMYDRECGRGRASHTYRSWDVVSELNTKT